MSSLLRNAGADIRRMSIVGIGLLGFAAGLASASAADLRPVKYFSAIPTLTGTVPMVVKAKKFDEAHGITMDIRAAGSGSSILIDAVLAGEADFASPGTITALQAIRAGADIKILAPVSLNQLTIVINNNTLKKLNLKPDAPIADRIKALKGLTIGTNPVGATYRQMLVGYLKDYGINADNEVTLVGVNEESAFMSGLGADRFDAIATASGVAEQAIALGTGTLWIAGSRGDIPGSEKVVVAVIIARSDFVEKRKQDVDAFRAAIGDAQKALREQHADVGKILKPAYFPKFDDSVWALAWGNSTKAFPSDLTFSRATFDYWINSDPKGAESYKDVSYEKVVYAPAQAK